MCWLQLLSVGGVRGLGDGFESEIRGTNAVTQPPKGSQGVQATVAPSWTFERKVARCFFLPSFDALFWIWIALDNPLTPLGRYPRAFPAAQTSHRPKIQTAEARGNTRQGGQGRRKFGGAGREIPKARASAAHTGSQCGVSRKWCQISWLGNGSLSRHRLRKKRTQVSTDRSRSID